MKKINKNSAVAVLVFSLALGLMGSSVAYAATAPSLGVASPCGVAAGTFTNSLNTGTQTIINGSVCYTTPPATAPITITGATTVPCAPQVGLDQSAALSILNTQACTNLGAGPIALNAVTIGANPPGTFPPGCYSTAGAMNITLSTAVTLDGPGVYVFRAGGALTTGQDSQVILTNGANAADVFWAPVAAVTLGANSAPSLVTPTFVGNILDAAGITIGHFAHLLGRALSFGGTVTTDSNTITVPTTLHVIKTVVNGNGGTAVPSDFTVHVKSGGVDVSGSPTVGTATPGTSYSLLPGTYTVSENANASYTQVFSGDCDASGNITLALGSDKTCTIVNTDIPVASQLSVNQSVPPLISVMKVPSPLALPSGPGLVFYTYKVKNVGYVEMTKITLVDDKCTPQYVSGDVLSDSKLDVDEEWTYRCSYTLSQTTKNTAIATGRHPNGLVATDIAIATVVVGLPTPPPLINVVKKTTSLNLLFGGGPVTYTYTVTNPGVAPLENVTVSDDKCTGLPGRVSGHPGDLNKNNLLESNEVWTFTCRTNLTETTTNKATAEGSANGLTAVDYALATVVVASPRLPNTGIDPEKSNAPWTIAVIVGILAAISIPLVVTSRLRRKVSADR